MAQLTFDLADDEPEESVTFFVVPSPFTVIGRKAFWLRKFLNTVHLPLTLLSIEQEAFFACRNLCSVSLPESLLEIHYSAFRYCRNLSSIKLPSKLRYIGACAFEECNQLQTINFPDSLCYIGDYAFSNTGLTSIEVPPYLTTIFKGTFAYTNVERVLIPRNIRRIEEEAFKNCKNLMYMKLHDGVVIKKGAFEGCSGLHKASVCVYEECNLADEIDGVSSEFFGTIVKETLIREIRIHYAVNEAAAETIDDDVFDAPPSPIKRWKYNF